MKKVIDKMTDIELLEILKIGETVDVECKEGENKIPNSLTWEELEMIMALNSRLMF